MNPQYYIKITPEKERELFDFIIKECNGVVFGFFDPDYNENKYLCEYVHKNYIQSELYFISYQFLHDNQIVDSQSLYLDEDDLFLIDGIKFSFSQYGVGLRYNAPYIQYSRFGEINRVYVDYSGMTKKSKQLLSPLYNTIKKWVKKNAVEIEKMDILNIYHIR